MQQVLDNVAETKTDLAAILERYSDKLVHTALPEYLARQRWFGDKTRAIESVRFVDILPVGDSDAVLALVEILFADGKSEQYQVPLAIAHDRTTQEIPATAIVAILHESPNDVVLYDGVYSEKVRQALHTMTRATDEGVEVTNSRIMSAEQSNTSIVYGTESILKIYRRVQQGENPDVEISRFLTSATAFKNVPAYLGSLRSEDGSTLAFLQAFTSNDGDGWQWISKQLQEPANETLTEAVALLGQRTAEMHLALATPTEDLAFQAEPYTANDLAVDSARIHQQVVSTVDALKTFLMKAPEELRERIASLIAQKKELLRRVDSLATGQAFRFGRRIRIHGDYHLGQVLRANNDFVIVDFEGEPAAPLSERRRKQSPLRDVAGMIRSFSYAAFTAEAANPRAPVAAETWQRTASAAFLASYRSALKAAPELMPQPEQSAALLQAFLLEKVMYELLYEMNNRPSWVHIPLAGVHSLLAEGI